MLLEVEGEIYSGFISQHLDTLITVFMTLIGFVVTYIMTQQAFKDEIRKYKINHTVEVIQDLTFDICELMDRIGDGSLKSEQFKAIMSKILAYGSEDAIKIAIQMQRCAYDSHGKPSSASQLALYALLITQLKYDLTSEIVSPESYFLLRIKDYDKLKKTIQESINSYVKELKLNKHFIVNVSSEVVQKDQI